VIESQFESQDPSSAPGISLKPSGQMTDLTGMLIAFAPSEEISFSAAVSTN
jgi:hypothetical protein